MYLNKKGAMMRVIVLAIPVIIIAGILFFTTSTILQIGEDSVNREACRDSVLLKERSKILGNSLIDNVVCETNLIEIKSTDKNEIYGEITNEMYDCWYQFGEGKRDFLDNNDFGRGDNWCFICSRIDFEEDVQGEISELDGLLNYLATEPVPLLKDKYFLEYFYGSSSIDDILDNFDGNGLKIDVTQPAYVAFLGDKRTWLGNIGKDGFVVTAIASTTGCLLGGTLGLVGFIGGPAGLATVAGGCVVGAKLGLATGALFTVYETTSVKHGYVSQLYVGEMEGAIDFCNT